MILNEWPPLRLEPEKVMLMRRVKNTTATSSIVLAALLATGCVNTPHLAHGQTQPAMSQAPETPEQFLGKLLGHYKANSKRPDFSNPKMLDRVFEPTIVKALNDPRWTEEGALNFDLVCVCNDSDISDLSVTVSPQKDPSHVTAVAQFNDMGAKRQLTYDLVRDGLHYKIYDVKSDKPKFDLRSFLASPPVL